MTYTLLIALCIIILLSYVFDITSRFSKIPGVILLILTGMAIHYILEYMQIDIPNVSGLLPVMGTLGLILIVLDASLDLSISREKIKLITNSVSSAIFLFVIFVAIFSLILIKFYHYPVIPSLLNAIPLGVISSAVAIPSSSGLQDSEREFITYESSLSDIVGILAFDFVLRSVVSSGRGPIGIFFELLISILASVLLSAGLAFLLHKISHHVKYVIIMTAIVLVYALAKLIHMPSLLVVLIFGLVMNNNHFFNINFFQKHVDFKSFNLELKSFKNITGELTFVVRSFFFIMFGYYTNIRDLLSLNNLLISLLIASSVFLIRMAFFRFVLRIPLNPLVYFAPRGLITILLFLSIPAGLLLPFMNQGVVIQVIFLTILMMAFGNLFFAHFNTRLKNDPPLEITNPPVE
jgi:Kef-type K+ transport system membrane component KefB